MKKHLKKLSILAVLFVIVSTPVSALDLGGFGVTLVKGDNVERKRLKIRGHYYEFTSIADVELRMFSHWLPVEIKIRDTKSGYLIACAVYNTSGAVLDADWGFAQYKQTSFYFDRSSMDSEPTVAKCYRTEGLHPVKPSPP